MIFPYTGKAQNDKTLLLFRSSFLNKRHSPP